MAYEVLARKWRPQQFEDVVGQAHVTRTLRNAISAGRLAHAYLFVGPRGTGKTSLARILAKGMNCAKGPTATPCDRCDACREIIDGRNLDVQEIDGASHTSVDQVRDLRDSVKYAPARGPHRIYIIDEVHMLSNAAFNALLKTLEEPPPHVKFMFATTEPEKIPGTILSRCQRFDLRRIPLPLLVERLKLICGSEGFEASDEALAAIARGAEGGLRDAESALDQIVSFCGKKIEESDVLSVFGLVSGQLLRDLAGCVLAGDIPGIVRTVAELDSSGKDLQRLLVDLLMHFRDLLVCRYLGDGADSELLESDVETLRKQAAIADPARVVRITEILSEAEERIRQALSRRTLLEVTLIRCARAASVASLDEVLARVTAMRDAAGPGQAGPGQAAPGAGGARGSDELPLAGGTDPSMRPGAEAADASRAREDLRRLVEGWKAVVNKAGTLAVGVRNLLVDAEPVSVSGETVTIRFDPEFESEIAQFDVLRNRQALETAVSGVLGRRARLAFVAEVPGERPVAEQAEAAAGPTGNEASATAAGKRRTAREWAGEPAVKKVMDMFDGSIADVRDL
jgi:DNA polymerase-3 subunit gamma/tau